LGCLGKEESFSCQNEGPNGILGIIVPTGSIWCVLSSKNPWSNHQGIPCLITGNSRVLSSAQESMQISRSYGL
jgi:hypothetical protein